MLYSILHVLVSIFAKIIFRLEVIGAGNVPSRGGVIIAANHRSYLDIPLLGCSVKRHLDFVGKKELFHIPVLGYIFRILGGFPIDRDKVDRAALREAVKRLRQGRAIVIYPEGTRSRNGRLLPGRPGVGLIVKMSNMKVVPVAISGTEKAMPPGSWFIRPAKVRIKFGHPLSFEEIVKHDRDCVNKITEHIMSAIDKLLKDIE